MFFIALALAKKWACLMRGDCIRAPVIRSRSVPDFVVYDLPGARHLVKTHLLTYCPVCVLAYIQKDWAALYTSSKER